MSPLISENYKDTNKNTNAVNQATATAGADLYAGIDVLSSVGNNLQQFVNKTPYDASAKVVTLPPPESEGQSAAQPYGLTEQRIIRSFYSQGVLNSVANESLSPEDTKAIYDALMSDKPLQNTKLATIAKKIDQQVTADTREQARLPDNWTLDSTHTQAWIPTPLTPYSADKQTEIFNFHQQALKEALMEYPSIAHLSPEQTVSFLKALQTGEVPPELTDAFHAIQNIATQKTQQTYGLPKTWSPEKTDLDNWKPVNLGIITPQSISDGRSEMIIVNLDILMSGLENAAAKVRGDLSPDDPAQVSLADFIRTIGEAIRNLKVMLREIQTKDAEKSHELSALKYDKIKDRQSQLEETIKKREEIAKAQKKQNEISTVLKIVGPIIAAAATLLAVATFGLASPLAIAGITVGIALTTYSVVDSATGCTNNLMKAFNAFLAEQFPGEDQTWLRTLVKALIIATVVAVLAAAIVFTGGGAGANVAAQASGQIAKQAVLETIKQLSIQAIIMAIMSSNVIPELFSTALIESGAISKDDKKGKFIAEMIAVAITLVTVMVATAAGGKASGTSLATTAKEAVHSVQQFGQRCLEATKKAIEAVKQGAEEALQMLKSLIKMLSQFLKNTAQVIAQLPAAIAEGLKNGMQRIRELIQALAHAPVSTSLHILENLKTTLTQMRQSIAEALKAAAIATGEGLVQATEKLKEVTIRSMTAIRDSDTLAGIKQIGEGYANLLQILKKPEAGASFAASLQDTLQLTTFTIQATDGIIQGTLALQVKKLLEQLGEVQYTEEITQAFIKVLEELLGSLQAGMNARGEFLTSLQTTYNALFTDSSQITTKLFQVQG